MKFLKWTMTLKEGFNYVARVISLSLSQVILLNSWKNVVWQLVIFFAAFIHLFVYLFIYSETLGIEPKALGDMCKQSLVDLDMTLVR